VFVQNYPTTGANVTAGGTASFVVWAWSTKAASSKVSVSTSITAASYLSSPAFTICPSASGATCALASLPLGQVYELLVSVPVSTLAPVGGRVAFTAKVTATGATPFSASTQEFVSTASTSTLPSSSSSSVPPLLGLPPIPGTGTTAINPSELFPIVSPTPGSGSVSLPGARSRPSVHAADVSSTVPIDARLIGAQIVGLAVLAGAVTIAIMRLSLRKRDPVPAPSANATGPDPQS